MVDKVEKDFGLISSVFGGILNQKDTGRLKLLLNNRLTYSTSVNQIMSITSDEACVLLGAGKTSDRSLYRTIEKVGRLAPIIVEKYQDVIKQQGFVDKNQNMDWSSSFFTGKKAEMSEFGYSRDRRPDKKQITFGISVGISGVPSALTVQNGNILDKKHFNETYNVAKRIMEKGSVLIFDCGANTKANKQRIVTDGFHYLTLKPKKVNVYRRHITQFKKSEKVQFNMDDKEYFAVKIKEGSEYQYIYFCLPLLEDQIHKKQRKFERRKKKGNELAKKAAKNKAVDRFPSEKGWIELYPELQLTVGVIENPYITGVEGFFILESTINTNPIEMLNVYKQRDAAEKLIRNLKEGIEIRPIRHFTRDAIIGSIVIAFLAESLINLTQLSCKNPLVKNVKLLKKYLTNLTLTFVYPENRFKFLVVSNVSPPISELFGDFWRKYESKDLNLRW